MCFDAMTAKEILSVAIGYAGVAASALTIAVLAWQAWAGWREDNHD